MPTDVISRNDLRDTRFYTSYIELKLRTDLGCYICKQDWLDLTFILNENYIKVADKYYILPCGHKTCREVFNLCPPLK